MPTQIAHSAKVRTFLKKKEEIEKALKQIPLEDALNDAPNLVRFLRKKFEGIQITDIVIDDDPQSRLMIETVHLVLSRKMGNPYIMDRNAEYVRVMGEFGEVTCQRYSCDGKLLFDYRKGRREDRRKNIPFP